MIRNTKIFLFLSIFTLNSCETLQDMAGLTKPNLENDLVDLDPFASGGIARMLGE